MKYSEILRRRYQEIKDEHRAIAAGEDPRSIIPTGLVEFDKRAGHKRKILALYGAATGEGKSIVKLNFMRGAAMAGYSVFVLDFEDPEDKTADREFSFGTGINSARMASGDLSEKEIAQIGLALAETEGWADNVEVALGVKDGGEALALLQENVADLNLVDYLSALPHGEHGRERAISDFCWGATKVAQESNVSVVAFNQLTAEVTARGMRMYEMQRRSDKFGREGTATKPYIEGFRGFDNNDLAWSKDAGKTAKELGFLFRPGRYYKRLDPGTTIKDDVLEFSFPKRNFGAEGTFAVGFDAKTARLFNLPTKK